MELIELQAQEGPCPQCFHTGQPVVDTDLAAGEHGWPAFAPVALEAGFRSVHAVPMRMRGEPVGAVNLFGAEAGGWTRRMPSSRGPWPTWPPSPSSSTGPPATPRW